MAKFSQEVSKSVFCMPSCGASGGRAPPCDREWPAVSTCGYNRRRGLAITQWSGRGVIGQALSFFGEVGLDGVDEDEFFAATALVIEPAPLELAVVAEVVDGLDAAGDEGGGLGNADPGGGSLHAEADFAVNWGGKHFEEPLLLEDGGSGGGELPVWGW